MAEHARLDAAAADLPAPPHSWQSVSAEERGRIASLGGLPLFRDLDDKP